MKKITLLLILLTVSFGYSQAPSSAAPTPPARDAVDVISIFSQTTDATTSVYADVAATDFNPNWGSTSGNVTIDMYGGDRALTYPAFDYQGTQFGSAQNIAAMEFLHVDIWIDGTFSPNAYVISSGGEIAHPITNTGAGSWISVDIAVAGITGDTSNCIQFKFDGGNSTDNIYLDNLYFWKPTFDPLTDATLSDLTVDGTTVAGFDASTLSYDIELPAGTTVVPTVVGTPTQASPATAATTDAIGLPGASTVLVTAQDGNTTETYTVNFNFPSTNTDCAGFSMEATEGTFSSGYNYLFETSGTDVTITFEILDTDKTGLVGEVFIEPSTFIPMTNTGGQTFTATLTGQVDASVISFSGRFPYAGGLVRTKVFAYTVGDDCGTLGLDDLESAYFNVYPNPSNNVWNIKTNSQVIKTIQVFDVLGKQVLSLNPNSDNVKIDASALTKGLYFAKINTEAGSNSVKLIKN